MENNEIETRKKLTDEWNKLDCWDVSSSKYRKFHNKAEKLGYVVYEHFDFCKRTTVPVIEKLTTKETNNV
tara:strand:+ start:262 stop:471 length:210 start_codon:yes stop_codon:yes gene_type:complete